MGEKTRRKPRYSREEDYRSPYAKDNDRVLYSSAFNRLAGVTQVVNPSEGLIFHNRLTHSIKVSQVGSRIAEYLLDRYFRPEDGKDKDLEYMGGLSPIVVSTAALAHDLGTPPFGHIAEKTLNDILTRKQTPRGEVIGDTDGFEGNAQSLRIVTKLSNAYEGHPGLNLTRATLNAILKYPWRVGKNPKPNSNKFGVYESEKEDFVFARASIKHLGRIKTFEASLMDLADDLTYAIHDWEDFYRGNIVPLVSLIDELSTDRIEKILIATKENWFRKENLDLREISEAVRENILPYFNIKESYEGSRFQRIYLHNLTGQLLDHLITNVRISSNIVEDKTPIYINSIPAAGLIVLKETFKEKIIYRPALLRQQRGEVQIIENLFWVLFEASKSTSEWRKIIPTRERELLEQLDKGSYQDDKIMRARIVTDTISSLSDQEAIRLHGRLTGIDPGSIFDYIM